MSKLTAVHRDTVKTHRELKMIDRNIHRTDKTKDFTVIDNRLIRDRRMSLGAKGLASVLLERPDDWKIYARDMVKRSSDGRATLNKHLDELEELGYLSRRRVRGNQGRFQGWDVQFYESPELNPLLNQSLTTNRHTDFGETRIGDAICGVTEIGISAPTKDGSELSPDLNQKRTEIKTNGTAGAREERKKAPPTAKTAAAAAEFLKILVSVSGEMAKPLQAPETLLADLVARGETPQTTMQAWRVCKTNARNPSGAFVYWLKSGYQPQQNFDSKAVVKDPPQFRATPPAGSSGCEPSLQETPEERKARTAAELAAMQAKTEAGEGSERANDEQKESREHSAPCDEETAKARRKAELNEKLAAGRRKAELAAKLAAMRGGSG